MIQLVVLLVMLLPVELRVAQAVYVVKDSMMMELICYVKLVLLLV